MAGAGIIASANELLSAPLLFTEKRVRKSTLQGEILFQPYYVQTGRGPHMYDLVWATDENWDTFYSNIDKQIRVLVISDTNGSDKFGITAAGMLKGSVIQILLPITEVNFIHFLRMVRIQI
jgi:hypothetical protein